jgi:hypothetical protein
MGAPVFENWTGHHGSRIVDGVRAVFRVSAPLRTGVAREA